MILIFVSGVLYHSRNGRQASKTSPGERSWRQRKSFVTQVALLARAAGKRALEDDRPAAVRPPGREMGREGRPEPGDDGRRRRGRDVHRAAVGPGEEGGAADELAHLHQVQPAAEGEDARGRSGADSFFDRAIAFGSDEGDPRVALPNEEAGEGGEILRAPIAETVARADVENDKARGGRGRPEGLGKQGGDTVFFRGRRFGKKERRDVFRREIDPQGPDEIGVVLDAVDRAALAAPRNADVVEETLRFDGVADLELRPAREA